MSTEDAVRILLAGGNLWVKATDYPVDDLVRMALAANNRSHLMVCGATTLRPDAIVRIALAAPGRATFDLS